MKLSIITINRNNAEGLARTLESTFAAQSGFGDWEQIVVDGASTDGSFAALDKWKDDPHLGWHVSEPDAGIYNAMNKGIAHSRGDYLLFLNSGDELLPDTLENVFAKSRDEDIIYGDLVMVNGRGNAETRNYPDADEIVTAFFLFWSLPHPASFISRKLLESTGGYDDSFRIVSDAKFFLQAVTNGAHLAKVPFPISRFHLGGASTDPVTRKNHLDERETMLASFFGPWTAHQAVHPFEGRPWIRADIAEAAKKDQQLATMLRYTASLLSYLWRFAPTRLILRTVCSAASFVRRLFRPVARPW